MRKGGRVDVNFHSLAQGGLECALSMACLRAPAAMELPISKNNTQGTTPGTLNYRNHQIVHETGRTQDGACLWTIVVISKSRMPTSC
jgi:hypothetical protein